MCRSAQQRAAVRRLTDALAASLPAADIQQIVVEEACRLTGAGAVALGILSDSGDMLDIVAAAGDNAREVVGLRTRVSDSLSASVVLTGEAFLLDGSQIVDTSDLFAVAGAETRRSGARTPAQPAAPSGGPRSAAVVALRAARRVIGTLTAINRVTPEGNAAAFATDDLESLSLLADFAVLGRGIERSTRLAGEQQRELAVLYEAVATVSSSLNVQQVLDSVLTALWRHLEHRTAVLWLMNDERTHLFIAADRGLSDEDREVQLAVESGMPARVLQQGELIRLSDTDEIEGFEELFGQDRARSLIAAPIRSRDEILGLVLVTSLQRSAYSEADLKLLAAVGMQAGIAIENAWLYEDAQRRAEEASALFDLSTHVSSTFQIDRVLSFVADSVITLLKVDRFALQLYDRDAGKLITRLSRYVAPEQFDVVQPGPGEGIAGWVFEWQTPQAVSDVAADPRNRSAPIDAAGVTSTLCVPMQAGDDVIGVIQAMSSKRRLFTVQEMELLYTVANQAAIAVVNAERFQQTRARSHEIRRYMRRLANAIGAALEESDAPHVLCDLAIALMRADRGAVYRVEGDQLRLLASSGFRASGPDETVPVGQGLAGVVARRGQSFPVAQLREEPRALFHSWLARERLTSYLGIPINRARKTVGVLEVYSQEPHEYSREEAHLLSTFARRARFAEKLSSGPTA